MISGLYGPVSGEGPLICWLAVMPGGVDAKNRKCFDLVVMIVDEVAISCASNASLRAALS